MSHAVIIKKAVKKYGNFTALNGVDLEIKPGEFFTLLGPSGCGKTTLLRMIAGFNSVDGGEICFDDKVINNLEAHKRDIGMVFQNYAIFPHLTVAENVAYGLKAKKCPKEQIPGKVEAALELVQIGKLKDRKPNELSGGQQQRVALARAFVIEPGVLLMDEPLSNLDAKLRESMRYEIKEIQKKLHITVVYVTHDQIEAMTMSDRVFIINRGIVQQVGTPLEIYRHPANQFVADFVGKVNFVKGTAERGIVRLKGIDQSLSYNGPLTGDVIVAIRPENIQLTEAEGHLRGKLASMFYLGDVNDCRVDIGNTELRVTADSMTYDTLQAGADVGLVLQDFLVYPDDGDEDFNKILT